MQLTVTVCNVCQDPAAPTKSYDLGQGSRKATVDLCSSDAQPFERLLKPQAKRAAKKAAVPSGRSRGVTTMADIEKLKQKV